MNAKFDFFEIVKIKKEVLANEKKLKMFNELAGIIKGKAQNDDGSWGYAVYLEETGTVWCFEENELESTGQFSSSTHNSSGDSVKVIVQPDGTGTIKDDQDAE